MTLNFNIKQKRYAYSNLEIVLNNVELVSIGKKKSRFFHFWPHDFDFAPLWGSGASKMRWNALAVETFQCIIRVFYKHNCQITTIANNLSVSCCSMEKRPNNYFKNSKQCQRRSAQKKKMLYGDRGHFQVRRKCFANDDKKTFSNIFFFRIKFRYYDYNVCKSKIFFFGKRTNCWNIYL